MEVTLDSTTLGTVTLIVGIATLFFAILFGMPTFLHTLAQAKEMKRKKRDDICALLKGRNWNNLGIDPFPWPAIAIKVIDYDKIGMIRGEITNCSHQSADLDLITFDFSGKVNAKGNAILTLQTSTPPIINVGVAQIKYNIEKDTLDYHYLHDHVHNPQCAHQLGLPRFTSYGLFGC